MSTSLAPTNHDPQGSQPATPNSAGSKQRKPKGKKPPTATAYPATTSAPSLSVPLQSVLQDLESRFLLNLPDSELTSFDRLYFHLQQAHWFYLDHIRPHSTDKSQLPAFKLQPFCQLFFTHSPLLHTYSTRFQQTFESFQSYLQSVPVCGAIVINEHRSSVVMVQHYKGTTWGYPKGKIDENESDVDCAIREVKEEIGYDIADKLDANRFIERTIHGKTVKLYLVFNVPENTHFQTQTTNEIKKIGWVDIHDLPLHGDKSERPGSNISFWAVTPFTQQLLQYISQPNLSPQHRRTSQRQSNGAHLTTSKVGSRRDSLTPPPPATVSQVTEVIKQQSARSSRSMAGHPHHSTHHSHSAERDRHRDTVTFGELNQTQWSAAEMFATNEKKFGLNSTVPKEELEVPDNIDEIMAKVYGRNGKKFRQSTQQHNNNNNNNNNNDNNNNNNNKDSNGHSNPQQNTHPNHKVKRQSHSVVSTPSSSAVASTVATAHSSSLSVDQMDFAHNPFVTHKLQQQNNDGAITRAASALPANNKPTSSQPIPIPTASSSSSHTADSNQHPLSASVPTSVYHPSSTDFRFDFDQIMQSLASIPQTPT